MTVARIDQVIPTLASRDAIGGHVVQLRDLLRSQGLPVGHLLRQRHARPARLRVPGRPGSATGPPRDGCCSTSCPSAAGWPTSSAQRRERKFVNYHNITPADLLEAWMPAVGDEVRRGRAQLRDLAPVTEFAIADSAFNERELQAAGYRVDHHRPAPHRPGRLLRHARPGRWPPGWPTRRQQGGADLLFVGKVSPHKGQHDLVKALAAYRRLYDPERPPPPGGRRHQRGVPDGRGAVRRRARTCSTRWSSPARSPTRS